MTKKPKQIKKKKKERNKMTKTWSNKQEGSPPHHTAAQWVSLTPERCGGRRSLVEQQLLRAVEKTKLRNSSLHYKACGEPTWFATLPGET